MGWNHQLENRKGHHDLSGKHVNFTCICLANLSSKVTATHIYILYIYHRCLSCVWNRTFLHESSHCNGKVNNEAKQKLQRFISNLIPVLKFIRTRRLDSNLVVPFRSPQNQNIIFPWGSPSKRKIAIFQFTHHPKNGGSGQPGSSQPQESFTGDSRFSWANPNLNASWSSLGGICEDDLVLFGNWEDLVLYRCLKTQVKWLGF